DLLFELRAAHGTTLLLITHDRDLARRCDRVVHMEDGRIVESADAEVTAFGRRGVCARFPSRSAGRAGSCAAASPGSAYLSPVSRSARRSSPGWDRSPPR